MTASPLDSGYLGGLFGDPEVGPLFSDAAAVAAMIRVERGLAVAQAHADVIPEAAGQGIDAGLANLSLPPESLRDGTTSAGVPVPALVVALRAALPADAGQWVHWGATSQDIVDTALTLRLVAAVDVIAGRLDRLIAALKDAATAWADTPMAGRTRSQVAAPISFGLRCATWAAPLIEAREDLDLLRGRVCRVQLGGAVGTNSVLGPQAPQVVAHLAAELGLAPAAPWHTNRAAFGALAGWCAGTSAATAKMAADLILMGRSESGEARAGAGGGSSTMPQKANPVAAEAIIALARFSGVLCSAMPHAAIAAEERDGAAWALEWLTFPQMVVAAAAALRHALDLATTLSPSPERMANILSADGGTAMAEAASFALSSRVPRAEATAIVKQAVAATAEAGVTLQAALDQLAPDIDWRRTLDPGNQLEAARRVIDGIFSPK